MGVFEQKHVFYHDQNKRIPTKVRYRGRLSVFVFSIRKAKRSLFQSNFVKPKFFFVNFVVYRPVEEANVVLSLSCPTDQETVIWS